MHLIPTGKSLTGRRVSWQGQRQAKSNKKQQKATKSSRNPPGMSGFSLAAEKRGASAECVGVDLRQSRGRNMIVSLRAVDWSNASRSDLEHEGERPQLQVLCIRISS